MYKDKIEYAYANDLWYFSHRKWRLKKKKGIASTMEDYDL